ncbi:zinc finger AN1 and C2H2 domain-containing stress-associated protein 11-like [Cucurbita pepo subsp. pepo]|uniref:zinc finger AN1 and C2H2 domain-containing stress-associated protein 11-like n=1 Tax=Cucurbita pepo subsp. pepo TaxID=3664 RepID=UPI000C9D3C1C|nr:zinc finger AN1 and C2H2 domain-containing stress-associated protein 11-like [Cucurbita pepo subsp. pepo]
MGTPEFPNLGKHCSFEDCKQIDFLPFTCDCCHQVFCLEHRSYNRHSCPKTDRRDVTVVICPLCAKGVRLIPDQDPNITWEIHVNTECDPSNYDKVTKKKKCPVPGCRELLTFSNTIKCRDCLVDHCLKHRFGPDHKCSGPKKPEPAGFPFVGLLSRGRKEEKGPKKALPPTTSSSSWTTSLFNAASSVKASAEASMTKLSNEINHAWKTKSSSSSSNGSANGQVEQCPQCGAKFSSVSSLIDHVEKVHEKGGNRPGAKKVVIDACPKCSRGFVDPVALVEHIEREHGGTSRA